MPMFWRCGHPNALFGNRNCGAQTMSMAGRTVSQHAEQLRERGFVVLDEQVVDVELVERARQVHTLRLPQYTFHLCV